MHMSGGFLKIQLNFNPILQGHHQCVGFYNSISILNALSLPLKHTTKSSLIVVDKQSEYIKNMTLKLFFKNKLLSKASSKLKHGLQYLISGLFNM